MNWALASMENSISWVLILKPCKRGWCNAFLYTKIVLGVRERVALKKTKYAKAVALVRGRSG